MKGDCKLKEVTGLSYSPVSLRFQEAKGGPHNRGTKSKFRLPLVAVFATYSFQNYGSLHRGIQRDAQIQTVDLSTAFCTLGS